MPDWRNAEDYAFTKELSPNGWAWEFLRRNPAYREDYAALSSFLLELEQRFGSITDPLVNKALMDEPGAYCFDPPRQPNESVGEWSRRCIGQNCRRYRIDVYQGRQWGLNGPMIDPFADDHVEPSFITNPKWPRRVFLDECQDYFSDEGHEPAYPKILFGFSFDLPIESQIKRLRSIMGEISSELEKDGLLSRSANWHHPDKWRNYLRVLDGFESGATATEIGDILFPGEDDLKPRQNKVKYQRKKAEELRDDDYITIPNLALRP